MKRTRYNNSDSFSTFLTGLVVSLSLTTVFVFITELLLDDFSFISSNTVLALATISVVIALFTLTIIIRVRHENSETRTLNRLLEYSKQRREIEQEIAALTHELSTSSFSEYLDINRIAFSGQSYKLNASGIDYNKFLQQFGIQNNELKVNSSTALFLTPFNNRGELLFQSCQHILGEIGIYLQKTDNIVNKDDILMNIVTAIVQAEIILVNIDGRNPNVYYELGIAHAIGKPTILLSKAGFNDKELESISFDVRQKRIIMYRNMDDLEKQLLYQINRLRSPTTDNSYN